MFTSNSTLLSRDITTIITNSFGAIGNIFDRTLNQIIKSLFSNNEQGFAYDPNDLSTMFQDAAGTIPVTAAGQAVGLMLDKSKALALGGERWDHALTASSGQSSTLGANRYRIYSPDGAPSQVSCGTGTRGNWYEITFTIESIVSGAVTTDFSNTPTWNSTGVKKFKGFLLSPAITFKRSGFADAVISNISVKEISGNHAYQSTSAARPIFRQKPILGSDLLVNGTFSAGLTGWNNPDSGGGVTSASGGTVKLNANGGAARLRQSVNITSAGAYLVEVDVVAVTGGSTQVGIGNTTSGDVTYGFFSIAEKKRYSLVIQNVAVGVLGLALITISTTAYVEIENISVKELKGYRTDQNYIEYDGVDDKLITNLPAQLTGCTVIRAVPNVGTQILTNQTIPATYEDNKDHCGLIVINRALTPSETSAITSEFNKRAGV